MGCSLPVVISCVADEPVDFKVNLVFIMNGRRSEALVQLFLTRLFSFPLLVTGKSDNNILTLFPYLEPQVGVGAMQSACERWLSCFGSNGRRPVTVPKSLTARCGTKCAVSRLCAHYNAGKMAFDAIEHLAGTNIPGLPILRPKMVRPGKLMEMFENMLAFLRESGTQWYISTWRLRQP